MWSNKSFFLEFLEIYRKNECLWKVKSKYYYNKTKKKEGYAQLLAKGRTADPNFTEDDVKKKINNFRSSFRKEYKKVSASVTEENEPYVPKLWYYDHLLFLKDEEKDDDKEEYKEEDQSEVNSDTERSDPELPEDSFITFPSSIKRRRTVSPPPEENQEQIYLTHSNNDYEDNFDIVGKNVAIKLRQLRKDQAFIAEKLINDVIFEAQFNNLNKHAQIVIPSLQPDMLVVSTTELTEDD